MVRRRPSQQHALAMRVALSVVSGKLGHPAKAVAVQIIREVWQEGPRPRGKVRHQAHGQTGVPADWQSRSARNSESVGRDMSVHTSPEVRKQVHEEQPGLPSTVWPQDLQAAPEVCGRLRGGQGDSARSGEMPSRAPQEPLQQRRHSGRAEQATTEGAWSSLQLDRTELRQAGRVSGRWPTLNPSGDFSKCRLKRGTISLSGAASKGHQLLL